MILLIFLCMLLFASTLSAQEKRYYFYHPEMNSGTELAFNPLSVLVSGSFDILRNGTDTRDVFDQPYRTGMSNVWENLTHPVRSVQAYGSKDFFANEVLNFNLDPNSSQFLANYTLHVFGNGMQYVKMAEWYDHHRYPYPKLWSLVTTFSYQYMNEVLENGAYTGANVDPIADMLIFNPIGLLLFSTVTGKHFFSHTMPLYDWSPPAYYNPANREIVNTGQQYATKVKFGSSRYALFAYWGAQTVFGGSYSLDEHRSLSLGAGSFVRNVRAIPQGWGARKMIPETVPILGLFYDTDNSLLASLYISGTHYENLRVDIYPGLLHIGRFTPGLFVGYGEWEKAQFGVTTSWLPVGIVGNLR